MNNLVTVTGNVSYMRLERLIIMNLHNLTISGATPLDAPPPSINTSFTARNVDNGDLATFWIGRSSVGKLSLEVYKATGYTQGDRYNANFVYVAASS